MCVYIWMRRSACIWNCRYVLSCWIQIMQKMKTFVNLLRENISTVKWNKFFFHNATHYRVVYFVHNFFHFFHNKRKFLNVCVAYSEYLLLNLIICICSLCIVLAIAAFALYMIFDIPSMRIRIYRQCLFCWIWYLFHSFWILFLCLYFLIHLRLSACSSANMWMLPYFRVTGFSDFVHSPVLKTNYKTQRSENGSVFILRRGPWERTNLNYSFWGTKRVGVSTVTWGRKQIQFPKHCVLMDKVRKPSVIHNRQNPLEFTYPYFSSGYFCSIVCFSKLYTFIICCLLYPSFSAMFMTVCSSLILFVSQ
jgi:hypothetical protein